jgi:ethanolamine kinase
MSVTSSSACMACSARLGAHTRWNHVPISRSNRFRAARTKRLPHDRCWASHRANAKDESITQKIFDDVEQRIRRVIDISDDTALETKELSNGFCNSVVLVSTKEEKLVVKLYSELSLLRTEPHQRGVIDELANVAGLGPAVRSKTGEGIAHVFLPGRILEEKDMHTKQVVGTAAAKLVAAFHSLQVPHAFNTNEPLLWKWLDRMLEAIERSDNADVLPDEANLQALRNEVRRVSAAVQGRVGTTIVLAHGDLKPSNVILINEDPVDLQLIDLELSGPNYRGFDLMKLFRTSPDDFSESHFRNFLAEYCRAAGLDESKMQDIEEETKLFEPLTWLEAAIFFALVLVLEPSDSDDMKQWEALLLDRWMRYLDSAAAVDLA